MALAAKTWSDLRNPRAWVRTVAELTDDPRIRRRAVEEHAKLTMMRLFPGRPVADWASLADDALYR